MRCWRRDWLADPAQACDLLITDQTMPKLTGLELARQARLAAAGAAGAAVQRQCRRRRCRRAAIERRQPGIAQARRSGPAAQRGRAVARWAQRRARRERVSGSGDGVKHPARGRLSAHCGRSRTGMRADTSRQGGGGTCVLPARPRGRAPGLAYSTSSTPRSAHDPGGDREWGLRPQAPPPPCGNRGGMLATNPDCSAEQPVA